MPTRLTLMTDVLVLIALACIFVLAKKYMPSQLFLKIFVVLCVIAGVLLLVFFINAQDTWTATSWLRDIIANNHVLDRIFNNNGYSLRYKYIINGCLSFGNWIGYMLDLTYGSALHFDALSNSIFFDSFITCGLLGLVVIMIVFVLTCKAYLKYFVKSDDHISDKVLLAGFFLSFSLYSAFNYDMQPYIFFGDFTPYYLNGLFLVCLFIFGYVYRIAFDKKEDKKEEVKMEGTENEIEF